MLGMNYSVQTIGLKVRRIEVELMGILEGRQYVNSFMEGEIDEYDIGRLRMLEKI